MDAFSLCVYLFLGVAQISGRLEGVEGDTIIPSTVQATPSFNDETTTTFKPIIAPSKVLGISVIKATSESHTPAKIISTGPTTKVLPTIISVVSNAEVTTLSNDIPTAAMESLKANDDISTATAESIPTVETSTSRDDVSTPEESLTSSSTLYATSQSSDAVSDKTSFLLKDASSANSNLIDEETLSAGEESTVPNDVILPAEPHTESPTAAPTELPVPKACITSRGVLGSCVPRRYCDYGTIHIDRTLYAPRSYKRPCNDNETCCPYALQQSEEPQNDIKDDKVNDFDDDDNDF